MTAPLRVLLVEDSASDAKLVLRELMRTHGAVEMHRVETEADMRDALASDSWDIVLSDWSMPTFSALDALAVLRSTGKDLPFIIVSGTVGEEVAVEGMRLGAQDYVLKDRLARLAPAVERELRDREARMRTQDALRVSEARFARLAESGIIAICVADLHGAVYEANDAYLSLVGYSRDDLTAGAVNWSRMTPPECVAADNVALSALAETGVAKPWEKELLRKDGQRVPVLVGVAMLDHALCIAFLADLTERKRAEEVLLQTEAQLRQAQKMEAIGRLAGGVAHDFNNLLSVIISYAVMMVSDLQPGDPMEEGLKEIRLAGERAAALTGQLLAFSRRQQLRPRLVNLNEMVAQTDNMLQRLIGEDVALTRVSAPALPDIFIDPDQIAQVVMNLAVNARDAMPGGGQLTIETAVVERDESFGAQLADNSGGSYVMLAVADTGIGMDKETQARIFEPFFTTKEDGHGTGLGLSTVFGIVQQSGGAILVQSEPGRGTTFRIYFPVADALAVAASPVQPAPIDTLTGSETILLVEDEERVRVLASAILRRYGYNVLEAPGGGDALLICEQYPATIHLLLTDVVMHRMSGRQLADRLRPLRPELKVLYMSGYARNAIVRRGDMDFDVGFVQKPITPLMLAQAVRRTLDAPNQSVT